MCYYIILENLLFCTRIHNCSLYLLCAFSWCCILVEWAVWTSFTCLLFLAHCVCGCWLSPCTITVLWAAIINMLCTLSNVCMPGRCFCCVAVILLVWSTPSHADAGGVIATHLPKCKNLRKVTVWGMNPVPILLSVGSCSKLDEVVIWHPEHCKVGFPELWCPGAHRVMLLDRPAHH